VSAVQATRGRGRPYDPASRRRSQRSGAEAGAWVYIPAEELEAAGISRAEPAPFYRTHGFQRSRNAGSVIVSLYREP
jgi:hypothetical protein